MLAAVLALFCSIENACGGGRVGPTGILVATAGSSPFSDTVWLLSDDGAVAKRVLAPNGVKSYPFAFGRSMSGPFLVEIHQAVGSGATDSLWVMSSNFTDPRSLTGCDRQFQSQGIGAFDPANKQIAFVGRTASQANSAVWVCDIEIGRPQQISFPNGSQTWDNYPSWTPDGKNVLFLRVSQSGSRTLISNLWVTPVSGGASSMVIGAPIAAFCISPDGSILGALTADGLDLFRWPGFVLQRHLVSWQTLGTFMYNGGGMSFAADPPRIIIPFSQGQTTHVVSVDVTTAAISDLRQMNGRATGIAWLSK
jgi:hypothetical protein